jgi:hypothetical protein
MVSLFTTATKFITETLFPERKSFELEPTTTIAKVALLHYMPVGTKPSINNFSIKFDLPSSMQPLVRLVYHASREDLTLIDAAIIKALKKYPPHQGSFHRLLFQECIKGLAALKITYSSSSVTCMAIDKMYDYIQLELDKLKEVSHAEALEDELYTEYHIKALAADFEIIAKLNSENNFESQERYCKRINDLLDDQDIHYIKSLGVKVDKT